MSRLTGTTLCCLLAVLVACSGHAPLPSGSTGGTDDPGHLSLLPSTTEVLQAETLQLAALVRASDDRVIPDAVVSWYTSRKEVAVVDQSGRVSALAPGSVLIEAKYGHQTITRELTVLPNTPVSVVIANPPTSVLPGFAIPLSVRVFGAHNLQISHPVVTWSSDAPEVASVSSAGVVQGVTPGTATINVASGGVLTRLPFRVRSITPRSIDLTAPSDTLLLGSVFQLQANAIATDSLPLTTAIQWTVTGNAVTVSPTGLLQARNGGTATVTASVGNLSSTRTVNVFPFNFWATRVYFGPTEDLVVGESEALPAMGLIDASALGLIEPVSLSVSNPALMGVSGNVATAIAPGTVTVTASARNAAPVAKTVHIYPRATAPAAPAVQSLQVTKASAGPGWTYYQPSLVLRENSGLAGYRVTAVTASLIGASGSYSESAWHRVNAGASRTMWDTRYVYDDPFAVTITDSEHPTAMTIAIEYIDDAGNHGTITTTVPIP